MTASLSSRIAVAALTCGLALAGPAMGSASAEIRHGGGGGHGGFHGGFHGGGMHRGGGWHEHYAGRYHGGYGGFGDYGYAYGGGHYYGGYYAPGCIPVLGIVTGNYCGYYN